MQAVALATRGVVCDSAAISVASTGTICPPDAAGVPVGLGLDRFRAKAFLDEHCPSFEITPRVAVAEHAVHCFNFDSLAWEPTAKTGRFRGRAEGNSTRLFFEPDFGLAPFVPAPETDLLFVQETRVTVDTNTVTQSSLDGDTDGHYRWHIRWVRPTSGATISWLHMKPNGLDVSAASDLVTEARQGGSVPGGAQEDLFGVAGTTGADQIDLVVDFFCEATNDGAIRTMSSKGTIYRVGNSSFTYQAGSWWDDDITNLTSAEWTVNRAGNNILAGSHFILYKLRTS